MSENEVKQPKKPAPKPQAPPKKSESLIYAGPTLGNGQLSKYTVFKNGVLPAHVQEIVDAEKSVKSLLVPVSKLAHVESKLSDQTSVESARYAEAKTVFSKRGE